eukprot:282649-Pelagomonas_calceolata.AAC.4
MKQPDASHVHHSIPGKGGFGFLRAPSDATGVFVPGEFLLCIPCTQCYPLAIDVEAVSDATEASLEPCYGKLPSALLSFRAVTEECKQAFFIGVPLSIAK